MKERGNNIDLFIVISITHKTYLWSLRGAEYSLRLDAVPDSTIGSGRWAQCRTAQKVYMGSGR